MASTEELEELDIVNGVSTYYDGEHVSVRVKIGYGGKDNRFDNDDAEELSSVFRSLNKAGYRALPTLHDVNEDQRVIALTVTAFK